MADRSIKCPLGILEDVPIRVGKFYIPVDFVVLDMEEDSQIPIILGRPFLCTAGAVIDVKNGTLTLSVGDDKITFTLTSARKSPLFENTCCRIDVIDEIVHDELPQILLNDVLEAVLMLEASEGEGHSDVDSLILDLDGKTDPSRGCEVTNTITSCDKPQVKKLELKPFPSNLKYVYLDNNESFLVIVSSNLDDGQISKLVTVLRMHRKTTGYTIDDLTRISPDFCMHMIHLDEDHKPCIQGQRRLNLNILNTATKKDHYPLLFIDQMLERLAKHKFIYYLDGYSGFFQIPIHPDDQEKTTFTCPYGTFAYRRVPFGLCNAPAIFQRCMTPIFSDLIESIMEVFMDDFSVYGSDFDVNLFLNWEKCHFMVNEGVVLGHLISERGIHVDKAKIEVIEKLPPPVNVKGVRSFLGHAGIKEALINAPIIQPPDWNLPFEIMCDASDYVVGAVLGQRKDKVLHTIYYASKTLDEA
ncbi:uncharacterized protein LOC141697356 [Apium graveolens]|uniref:uncharacterized protein LOC141697356 n=1 Tax=Apium graveolens TaxID=4045 RepID=UPI003D7B0F13